MATATIQGPLWGAHAEDWANRAEPTTAPLWEAILDACEVGEGTKLLDAGCGGGGLAMRAAGRGAQVSGVDASRELLAIAARRVPSGRFEVGDLEGLPHADGSFDVVTACNSIQFTGDQRAALQELRRVSRGVVGIGMWCEPDRCDMGAVFSAVQALMPPPPPDALAPAPALAVRQNLQALVANAGLDIRDESEVECVFLFNNREDAWLAIRSAGILVGAAKAVGEDRLREAVLGGLMAFRQDDGSYRLRNWFRYLVCR